MRYINKLSEILIASRNLYFDFLHEFFVFLMGYVIKKIAWRTHFSFQISDVLLLRFFPPLGHGPILRNMICIRKNLYKC